MRWMTFTSSTSYRVFADGSATFEYPRTSQNPGSLSRTSFNPHYHFADL
jgi:hypothetical protein